jgi:hypothetical protein
MAKPNYFDPADIETQARYRPGVASNIFNVLTGGLAGAVTGSTQRAQEAARARQALLQEEFGKRDEQRMLDRQLMINALQSGIEQPAGATLEEKMADFRNKSVRKTLAAAQGAREGIQSPTGPYQSPYQFDPAFQIAAAQAQGDLEKRRAEFEQQSNLERAKLGPNLVAQLGAYGVTASPDMPVGQLSAMLEQERARSQSRIYSEDRGKQAKAGLAFLQQKGEIPMVEDLSKIPDEEAVVRFNILGREYEQKNREFQSDKKRKLEQESLKGFMQELKAEKPDKDKLQSLYPLLPQSSQDNEEFRVSAGVMRPMAKDEREALNSYVGGLGAAGSLAEAISFFQGTGELAKVSQKGFNGFKAWLTGIKNKYGVEDARYAALNDVIQEFEAYVGDKRKTLFGASLTGNELLSAKRMFGDPESANFLSRALKLIDSAFKEDVIEKRFNRNAIFVDKATQREVQDARQNWFNTRDQFGFLSLGKKGKIGQVVPAGGTNVMDTIIDMDAQGREIK